MAVCCNTCIYAFLILYILLAALSDIADGKRSKGGARRGPGRLRRCRPRHSPGRRWYDMLSRHQENDNTVKDMEKVRACLQEAIGPAPQVRLEPFVNWAEIVRRDHVFVIKPTTNEEVKKVIKAAMQMNLRIRVAGASALSWSDLFPDNGQILLDLADLTLENGQRAVFNPPTMNTPYSTVTVAAGVSQGELDSFLLSVGHTLVTGPRPIQVTMAGGLGTAAHGGSYDEPSIGGHLKSAKLFDAYGRLRQFSASKNPDVLRALRCHLGLLGVIVEVEIKVEPIRMMKVFTAFVPLSQMLNATFVKELVTRNYYVEARWAVYNSLTEEEVQETITNGSVPTTWNIEEDLVWLSIAHVNGTEPDLDLDFKVTPNLGVTPISAGQQMFEFLATNLSISEPVVIPKPFAIHGVDAHALPPMVTMASFIKETEEFSTNTVALQAMVSAIEGASFTRGILPVGLVEMRWVKETDCFLCPGRSDTCGVPGDSRYLALEVVGLGEPVEALEGFKQFVQSIYSQLDQIGLSGMPHWAKMAGLFPELRQKLNDPNNRQCTREFLKVRDQLDPRGRRFSNHLMRELFKSVPKHKRRG
ncbi:L-gulonolactone oxidase-like [Lingula anatina]|uniref:L-gulonolactone oxidase-like n=1 Tax=Lingula anatina TaxID=7574 RepID=A0A1S3K729_LINAN|nr:L-gulonolactone oxidase-like [Lingula anatina]|eukprot:XP_013418302.1 L-gulonolactone oxidase-like [Lingula anatina]